MRTIEQMVQQEILCCMSSMVSTLAAGSAAIDWNRKNAPSQALGNLVEQALELVAPIADCEEAAIQAGWYPHSEYKTWVHGSENSWNRDDRREYTDAEDVCNGENLDPYDREVFEHWAVTDWFADKLIEQGEKVDKDFGNLCIWARTTSGQGIASDGVVERIYKAMMRRRRAK